MNAARVLNNLVVLLALVFPACNKQEKIVELVIEIPAGFSGEVHIQTGVLGAAPLPTFGHAYLIPLPNDGHVSTSTIPDDKLSVRFDNSSSRGIWGYAFTIQKSGDGIPVGGSMDFFVGSKEQYEIQEAHKPKSEFLQPDSPIRVQ